MKYILLIILFSINCVVVAQSQPRDADRSQRWRELQLTTEQKNRIRIILLRQRIQQLRDVKETDEILTPEQKRKLKEWRKRRNKIKTCL